MTAAKISYQEYLGLLLKEPALDPDAFAEQSEEILKYSVVVKNQGGFDIVLAPDPEKVELDPDLQELENAMGTANRLARWRRQSQFRRRLNAGENRPVLVSEGDSWFQFPVLIKDVIDQLNRHFLIYSVGAAGDTAENMVYGPEKKAHREYMSSLGKMRDHVDAFLFSAAGNDIIGADPDTGEPVLYDLIRPFNGNPGDIAGHIDHAVLKDKLTFLKTAYRKVISDIRADPGFRNLPIVIHGYDYAFPYPHHTTGGKDRRNPKYADKNQWLGDPLDRRGIASQSLRRNLIKYLVDELYGMLAGLSANPLNTGVWLVDCRGAMPEVSDWNDEIHGTDEGYTAVAARFRHTIEQALAHRATLIS
ncbi:hypothetical protein [uncultured Roseibium sp.]|uniref:hypothetical protein n=1 Tax=uncultured Roseibium sp. TaxID=1936171 RepID=UPI0026151A15|nr:hypothetical protein [uncultured Roseibium sp.]